MVAAALRKTVDALSADERAELVSYLVQTYDSGGNHALTPELEQMLEARIASMEADPSIGIPWAEVQAQFEAKWG